MREYQLGLYEKSMPGELPLEQKLEEAGTAGFDYLELSIDETDQKLERLNWGEREIRGLAEAVRRAGIPIKSICLSGHRRFPLGSRDPTVRARGLEIMEGAVRLSARLGVRLIQLAGYDVYYEEPGEDTRRVFAENLAASVRMAAREGVMLGFETMETGFMNTVAKAICWVEAMNSPYLQVYPDIGNLTNAAVAAGADVLEDLRRGAGHLAAVHLKETVPGVFREVPYGTGHVDFKALAAESLALGVRLFVGEFWYTGGEDWRETLGQNNRFLRAALDNAPRVG